MSGSLLLDEDTAQTRPSGTAPTPGDGMLSAAHMLLNSARLTDERDLLISTCLEILGKGPMPITEITAACNEIWPGAGISVNAVREALDEGLPLELVSKASAEGSAETWTLGRQGISESDSTKDWLKDATERLANQIADRAREDFGEIEPARARNWALLIRKVFTDEIARSAATYSGGIQRGVAGNVRPMVLNGKSILHAVDSQEGLPASSTEFLKACIMAAVDETDPFGNELLGQVSTSCVLHAIAARRGRASAQEAMGSLSGTRIVVDTPILVPFLGEGADADRFSELVIQAIDAGVEVIVPEHVLEELNEVVQRVETQHVEAITHKLTDPRKAAAYLQMVDEDLLAMFVLGQQSGKYRRWADFRVRTSRLRSELEQKGVIVRPHGNSAPNVREKVEWLGVKLREQFDSSLHGRRRGEVQIDRDAESMEMVWRARRSSINSGSTNFLWPGGWLLTYDSKVGPAYRNAHPGDRESLVITPAQLLTLLTDAAPAAKIPDLVAAAASFMRQESMLKIATKYPPAVALTLAQTLSDSSSSATDMRVAQMGSLGELLGAFPADGDNGISISNEIGTRRVARLSEAGIEQNQMIDAERSRLEQSLTQKNAVVTHEQALRKAAERERNDAETALAEAQMSSQESLARNKRKHLVHVITIVMIAAAILLGVVNLWGFSIATLISACVLLLTSKTWIEDRTAGLGTMFWAITPVLIGIYDVLKWLKII